jgi:glucose-6-phosphate 1-epimerase
MDPQIMARIKAAGEMPNGGLIPPAEGESDIPPGLEEQASGTGAKVEPNVAKPLKPIELKNAAGDTVTAYAFGACVTSYVKNGVDALMVRPDAKLDGSKPISGGIPHCFPQFGPGKMQQHGFARNQDWNIKEQTETTVTFELTENEYTLSMWPYKFCATYEVELEEDLLRTNLCVLNTGESSFDFSAALHSYWSISGIANLKITSDGFESTNYIDKMDDAKTKKSTGKEVTISKETDSVYLEAPGDEGEIQLVDSARKTPLKIFNWGGWEDTVIWNPYGDEKMGYDSFVCVELAKFSPFTCAPGQYWSGGMDVIHHGEKMAAPEKKKKKKKEEEEE